MTRSWDGLDGTTADGRSPGHYDRVFTAEEAAEGRGALNDDYDAALERASEAEQTAADNAANIPPEARP